MHPPKVKEEALRLAAASPNDCEISRRMGIPRSTIRDWRRPTYVAQNRRESGVCRRASVVRMVEHVGLKV